MFNSGKPEEEAAGSQPTSVVLLEATFPAPLILTPREEEAASHDHGLALQKAWSTEEDSAPLTGAGNLKGRPPEMVPRTTGQEEEVEEEAAATAAAGTETEDLHGGEMAWEATNVGKYHLSFLRYIFTWSYLCLFVSYIPSNRTSVDVVS